MEAGYQAGNLGFRFWDARMLLGVAGPWVDSLGFRFGSKEMLQGVAECRAV
jgi:hypothetical protein